MIVRAKTKRRLIILLCGTFLIAGAIAGFVVLRLHQRNVQTEVYRSQGIAAFERGDYVAAAEKLQLYASRAKKPDPGAIYRLAQACKRLPDPSWDGCRAYLERFIDLSPTENDATREARRELVEALYQLHRPPEALKQANLVQTAAEAVLAKNPADANARNIVHEMLLTKARILYRDKTRLEEAIKAAWECARRDPLDVEAGNLLLDLYLSFRSSRQQLPEMLPQDIVPFFAQLALKNPADTRALTLAATAYRNILALTEVQRGQAQQLADVIDPARAQHDADAGKLTPGIMVVLLVKKAFAGELDAPTALSMASLLMQMGDFRDAVAALEKARDGEANAILWHNLICFLWESMRYDDVLQRLQSPRVNLRNDLDLLIAKADSLARLERKSEAKAAIDAIAALPVENHAKPWAFILEQCLLSEHPNCLKVIETARTLLPLEKDMSHLPLYLRMYMAQAYSRIGEYQQALDVLEQARLGTMTVSQRFTTTTGKFIDRRLPVSAALNLQLANACADVAKWMDALAHASDATRMSDSTAVLVGFVSVCERIQPSFARSAVQEVQRRIPGEDHTLAWHVSLLASEKPDEAKAAIRQSLASPTTRPSRTTLAELEQLSTRFNLGLENECEKRIQADGGYTPDAALVHGVLLHSRKQPEAAEAFFQAARKNKAGADDLSWRVAWARYLEIVRDPRAKAEWVAIAPDPAVARDASILRSALYAASVRTDLKFRDQIIERLRDLAGEKGINWRLARAQLYSDNSSEIDPGYVKAHKLLEEVLQITPARADVNKMLALIAVAQKQPEAQLEHLMKAAELDHTDMAVVLDLATLYQSRNDYQQARQQLTLIDAFIDQTMETENSRKKEGETKLTRAEIVAHVFRPNQRLMYARALLQQGNAAAAIEVLQPMADVKPAVDKTVKSQLVSPAEQHEARMLLAQIYGQSNRAAEAEDLFKKLLAEPDDGVRIAAAEFYASTNRADEAEKLMKQLQVTGAARDVILAQYYARHGTSAQAMERATAAVKTDPKNALAWQNLIFQHLSTGRIDDALKAIDQAAEISELAPIRKRRDLIAHLSKRPDLGGMMAGLLQVPSAADPIAEALGAYSAPSEGAVPMVDLAKLRGVADRYPTVGPIQSLMAIEYRRSAEFASAADVALKAATALPNSPEMAKLAAECLLGANNLPRAREFAQKWRDLTVGNPVAADTQLAQLDLAEGKFKEASDRLQPYVKRALDEPEKHVATVLLQVQLLIRQRDIERAASIMLPLMRKTDGASDWRQFALNFSMTTSDPKIAAQWLRAVSPGIPQADALLLGDAWYRLWMRNKDDQSTQEYRAIAAELLDRLPENPQAVELRAIIEKESGNVAAAEALYRKVLALNPKMPVSLNNLACMIAEKAQPSKEELKSAADMARKAIAIVEAATYYDTLATIHAKLGDNNAAIKDLRTAVAKARIREQPLWRMNLAELLCTVKQFKEADDVVAPINDSELPKEMQLRLKEIRTKIKDALKANVTTTRPANR